MHTSVPTKGTAVPVRTKKKQPLGVETTMAMAITPMLAMTIMAVTVAEAAIVLTQTMWVVSPGVG